jgi:hypothetical protein
LLVAPAVVAHLVPGGGDLDQRAGVQLGVATLDEERRPEIDIVQQREDPRKRARDGEVAPEGLVVRPQPSLQVRDLTEVVE